ncbi:hypothetical protein AA12717_0931 [Gluconacetobacter sacchari DSM 12717]|uniref:Uncharacterized protein n=2 Tax=Gluconacetobacter sacchari TaxID=92759 RepID=A0A7W4NPA3_9PROT|nr:hypothetical protein [Gluconacetobacter sacchari]MBB2161561.1 hypothetical protein [Gluconacetobacter sacchari]GBQ21571.1 hypothetical protein AA12717_0931 [Gluconacetobacter sacchari DSM 12717]
MPIHRLSLVFRGRLSAVPAVLWRQHAPVASVSVAPDDTVADVRERLMCELIRVLHPDDWQNGHDGAWAPRYLAIVEEAVPGPADAIADPDAPTSPLAAEPWPLAPDPEAYGERAGWWIVVDGTAERELSPAFPTRDLAEQEAERLNRADPHAEWYRHWFAVECEGPEA